MRVSIIGAGNTEYHYQELLSIPKEKMDDQIAGLAKALADVGAELAVTPDRGIPFAVAERYKAFGGKKVYGTVPVSDKTYGIKHLQDFMNEEVNGKKIVDEVIDTHTWYEQDVAKCIFGEVILVLAYSLGSMGELSLGYYIYKLASGQKLEQVVPIEKIHPQAVAGKRFPLATIVYMPFVKERLPLEIEAYINKFGGVVHYVHTVSEMVSAYKKIEKKHMLDDSIKEKNGN